VQPGALAPGRVPNPTHAPMRRNPPKSGRLSVVKSPPLVGRSVLPLRLLATLSVLLSLVWSTPSLPQFETRSDTTAQAHPFVVAAGDFNGDGKLDFADATNSLQIFLGNGDGTFQAPTDYLSNSGVLFVVAADLNGDKKLDLIVSNLSGLYVLMGNGDGTFQNPVSYSVPCTPALLAVGDFNGDKKPDLLVTYRACSFFSIYLGNGDGTFQQPGINTTPPFGAPSGTGIGDFNGDGVLDVAVGQQFGGISEVQIFLGNGDGTFSTGTAYNVGSEPESVTVSSFRGNGTQDLAVATLSGQTDILLGNGEGTFQSGRPLKALNAVWVLNSDFNGDGLPDLAIASQGSVVKPAGVYVAFGNGDGTFQPPNFFAAGNIGLVSLAAGDFNGDFRNDLIIPNYGPGDIIVLLNTGAAKFAPTIPIAFAPQLIGTASAPQTVTLTNTGKSSLSISRMSVRPPFQASNTCGSSVAPGATCDINVVFQPNAIGNLSGLLNISDSASSKPQVIELSGAGTAVAFSPSSLTFPPQKVGTQSTQTVKLANHGRSALSITLIYTGGTDYRYFAQTNNCPSSLAAGANCTISVTFTPQKAGTFTAVLGVEDNGGGSPQTIPISGSAD